MSVRGRLTSIRVAAVVAGLMLPAAAHAAITFDGVLSSGFPGSAYTEGGFTVTATEGTWFEAPIYGNPAPSIFAGPIGSPTVSTIEVTGGSFTFAGLDISSNNGSSDYSFTGFLGATLVYSLVGAAPVSSAPSFGFTSLLSGSTVTMDRLVVTITAGQSVTSVNIDNILVTAAPVGVPEPATLALVGFGLLGLAAVARRRAAG